MQDSHIDKSDQTSSAEQTTFSQTPVKPPQEISAIISLALAEKCRLNLIIHNLKESQESDSQKRKYQDINEANKLIQNFFGVSVSITNVNRIGNKGDKYIC